MPPRRSRAAAQAAAASIRTPTPHVTEPSDEEMADAPASGASSPQEDEDGSNRNSEQPSEPSTPARAPTSYRGRRRLGRPPKNRPPDWGMVDDGPGGDQGSETGTPFKRRRGRPPTGGGGGRWAKPRGGPSHSTQVPIDKEGNMMDVVDDEVALPEDDEGETKVDKYGRLRDNREYRCRTFTILGRGDRLYMLSTEPARCIGFRDSYLFFQKHKQLYKIIIDEREKKDLIGRDLIPHSYKGRAIGVVTARSVFREFGSRIVVGGKKIVDDYQVQAARENGDVEGEVADPTDQLPKTGEEYNKNQYVAWHGASSVYHSGGPSVPLPNGKPVEGGKKKKVVVTGVNWMFEHAKEASRFNSSLSAARRENLDGIYDTHTNMIQYPRIIQPTHVRWEEVESSSLTEEKQHRPQDTTTATDQQDPDATTDATPTVFPPLPPIYARNFLITDTHFLTPPAASLDNSSPTDADADAFGNDTTLSSISDDILANLPAGCLASFRASRAAERAWKQSWRNEAADTHRRRLRIGFN